MNSVSEDSPPLIFISHDSRDAAVAKAFAELLEEVTMNTVHSFRATDKSGLDGIEYSLDWYAELLKNIEMASDVVCLITSHSYDRPWIYFEAGYAKGHPDKAVHGLVLGMPMSQVAQRGPFVHFQNCADDPECIAGLVTQLATRAPNCRPPRHAVETAVERFREKLRGLLVGFPYSEHAGDPVLLHHASLPVTNLEQSVAFYRDVIGLKSRPRPGDLLFRVRGAWFELPNGQQFHLIENPNGNYRTSDEIDFNDCHFALRVPDVPTLRLRLSAQGYRTKRNDDITDTRYPHFYVLDPDRHVIEINGDVIVDKTTRVAT